MKGSEWEEVLIRATGAVLAKVSPLAKKGGRGRSLGPGASGDVTLYADKVAEDILVGALARAGKVRFLSEEAGSFGDPHAETLAIVDPLDGSSNFERGIPFYCTSVAIAEGESLGVMVGVVRDLVSGDVYAAEKGRGATKNGRRIRTSTNEDPSNAVVGVDLSRSPRGLVSALAPLVGGVKRQVHLGANALELCYLAEGRIDSFVDLRGRIRVTDFAAANLIAQEAGAVVTDLGGRRLRVAFDLGHRLSFVASANPALHGQVLELCGPPGGGS